jgi:hypothetical protein
MNYEADYQASIFRISVSQQHRTKYTIVPKALIVPGRP